MLDACREELEFIANTLIFILAGVIIAGNVYLSQHNPSSPVTIRGREYGYAFLLWIVLLVSRCSQVRWLHTTCKITRVKLHRNMLHCIHFAAAAAAAYKS